MIHGLNKKTNGLVSSRFHRWIVDVGTSRIRWCPGSRRRPRRGRPWLGHRHPRRRSDRSCSSDFIEAIALCRLRFARDTTDRALPEHRVQGRVLGGKNVSAANVQIDFIQRRFPHYVAGRRFWIPLHNLYQRNPKFALLESDTYIRLLIDKVRIWFKSWASFPIRQSFLL